MKKLLFLLFSVTALQNSFADHTCKKFGNGDKSYSTRIMADVGAAVAGVSRSNTLFGKLGFAFMPLFHDIAHEETTNLTGGLKILSNNWTSLSLASLVYTLKQTIFKEWTDDQVLNYILAAIYTQWATGIAVSKVKAHTDYL